jgi:sulfonate transport system ATP-binding protein
MPWLTVEENIAFGMGVKRWPKAKIKEQTEKIISLMGLSKCRKQYPHELSVSTEQKVVIGRAFAMEPDLLLMDDPTDKWILKRVFIWRMRLSGYGKNLAVLSCL